MGDPLLTTLCTICHVSPPQYRCPRCGTRTCSLACVRRHKSWAECSGERDATAYRHRRDLRTPAGIDHDYNFLHRIELDVGRTQRELVEERGIVDAAAFDHLPPPTVRETHWRVGRDGTRRRVVVTRELRATRPRAGPVAKPLAHRLRQMGVQLLCVPEGMSRRVENKTTLYRPTGRVNWQVEFFTPAAEQDGGDEKDASEKRLLAKALDNVPLYEAYHASLPSKRTAGTHLRIQHRDSTWPPAAAAAQDPATGRWVDPPSTDGADGDASLWPAERHALQRARFEYYLANPRCKTGQPRRLTRLSADETLADALADTVVIEFPSIYVLKRGAALPEGFVLGPKEYNGTRKPATPPATPSRKRSGGTQSPAKRKKGGGDSLLGRAVANKRRKRGGAADEDMEEGEVDDEDSERSAGEEGDGLELGDVIAEESFDEESDSDETSSSGSSSDDEDDE